MIEGREWRQKEGKSAAVMAFGVTTLMLDAAAWSVF